MNKRFHLRGFVSFAVAMSFLTLAFSGIVLYVSPRGRVANWTGWGFLGVEKESWGAVHSVMALAFVVLAVTHFVLNWKPFLGYLRNKAAGGIKLKWELVAAATFSAVVIGGTLFNAPPFSLVPGLAENIKDYWETAEAPAPYAHAELSTVAEFAERTGSTVEQVTTRLAAGGIQVKDPNLKIGEIAEANHATPSQLFMQAGPGAGRTPGAGSGFGMGRKSLREVCADEGLAVETAMASLRSAGIEAQADENMRSLAERAGKNPHDLLAIIKPAS